MGILFCFFSLPQDSPSVLLPLFVQCAIILIVFTGPLFLRLLFLFLLSFCLLLPLLYIEVVLLLFFLIAICFIVGILIPSEDFLAFPPTTWYFPDSNYLSKDQQI